MYGVTCADKPRLRDGIQRQSHLCVQRGLVDRWGHNGCTAGDFDCPRGLVYSCGIIYVTVGIVASKLFSREHLPEL